MFIGVAGNIGAGKTTLAHLLSDHFKYELLEESVDDNPFLDDYYKDMNRWAILTQLYFINSRVENIAGYGGDPHKGLILDRVLEEDKHIFTKYLHDNKFITDRELGLYNSYFDRQTKFLAEPSVLIYVQSSIERIKDNVAKRNRPFEADLLKPENTYLQDLNNLYEDWIGEKMKTDSGVIILNADRDNIIEDKEKREKFFSHIESTYLDLLY